MTASRRALLALLPAALLTACGTDTLTNASGGRRGVGDCSRDGGAHRRRCVLRATRLVPLRR